jgi:hypothetical protein
MEYTNSELHASKISAFFCFQRKELQHVNVNILQVCRECGHNNKGCVQHLQWSGWVAFMICWSLSSLIALQIQTCPEGVEVKTLYFSQVIYGGR